MPDRLDITPGLTKPHGEALTEKHFRSYKGMAHFAGIGPDGKQCRDCRHFLKKGPGNKAAPCSEYKRLSRDKVERKVPSDADACRYFGSIQTRQQQIEESQ